MTRPKAKPSTWTAPVFGLDLLGTDRRDRTLDEVILNVPLDDGDFGPITFRLITLNFEEQYHLQDRLNSRVGDGVPISQQRLAHCSLAVRNNALNALPHPWESKAWSVIQFALALLGPSATVAFAVNGQPSRILMPTGSPMIVINQLGPLHDNGEKSTEIASFPAVEMRSAAEWAWARWDKIDFAARRFAAAGQRPDPLDRLLDWMIALESLLCRGDSSEVSYKASTRAAMLLGSNLSERLEIHKEVGALYGIRSRIVHGSHGDLDSAVRKAKADSPRALAERAYKVARNVFLKLRAHPSLLERDGLLALSLTGDLAS